jgi:MEDS: MEthanogen/methylotroph, DcmR Sensory domain
MDDYPRHQCMIYEGPPSQKLPMLIAILKRKLSEGYRCMYLNSAPMVAGMYSYLAASGMDVALEVQSGRIGLSSQPKSSGGGFDVDRMLFELEDALDQALIDGYKGLWVAVDMTWEFGPKKDFTKLLEYEWGLEDIFRRRPGLCGICQYHRDTMSKEALRQGLLTHRGIVINDTIFRINPFYARSASSAKWGASIAEMDQAVNTLCQFGDNAE